MSSRATPESSADLAFTKMEIAILDRVVPGSAKQKQRQPDLAFYVNRFACFGGYLDRSRDPRPAKMVRRGLTRLDNSHRGKLLGKLKGSPEGYKPPLSNLFNGGAMLNFLDTQVTNGAGPDDTCLRIAGFGACMISGYPNTGAGFFEVACELVKERTSQNIQTTVVSLGGFTAPRAARYLNRKLSWFKPNYIVFQFGATDAACPIRQAKRRTSGGKAGNGDPKLTNPAKEAATSPVQRTCALSRIHWEITSLIANVLRPEPVTPLPLYISAIEKMMDSCASAAVTPVLLSPFIYGSSYSTKAALLYKSALLKSVSSRKHALFLDCIRLLQRYPKHKVLLHDGFHLSLFAHKLLGEAIGEEILGDIHRSR